MVSIGPPSSPCSIPEGRPLQTASTGPLATGAWRAGEREAVAHPCLLSANGAPPVALRAPHHCCSLRVSCHPRSVLHRANPRQQPLHSPPLSRSQGCHVLPPGPP